MTLSFRPGKEPEYRMSFLEFHWGEAAQNTTLDSLACNSTEEIIPSYGKVIRNSLSSTTGRRVKRGGLGQGIGGSNHLPRPLLSITYNQFVVCCPQGCSRN